MNLSLSNSQLFHYKSASQKARVLSESWVEKNLYCPNCSNGSLSKFPNNQPVADFFCPNCLNQFELKSSLSSPRKQIMDGAYSKMIQRINSKSNPDFLLMVYDQANLLVRDLIIFPKQFFTPGIIAERAPLSPNARRAGWIGCNIEISKIPEQGWVWIVKDACEINKVKVLSKVSQARKIQKLGLDQRGWIIEVMKIVNQLPSATFTLREIYQYEANLSESYPNNQHIKAKIRQQLQLLRDFGFLEFLGSGNYRRL